jgi:ankyrin repeat protein
MDNIWGAAEEGNLAEVQRMAGKEPGLLNATVRIYQDHYVVTPLMLASRGGRVEVVSWLLSKGAPVNRASAGSRTPLWFASDGGHVPVVRLLLEKGGDPTLADEWGHVPLFRACVGGHLETVRCLLAHPSAAALVNNRDKLGRTALLMASEAGHVEVLKALLEKGADPKIATIYGVSPIGIAHVRKRVPCESMLAVRWPLCPCSQPLPI